MPGIKKRSFVSKSHPNSFAAMEWRSLCPVAASGQPEASAAWNRNGHSRWEMPFWKRCEQLLGITCISRCSLQISWHLRNRLVQSKKNARCHCDAFGLKIWGTSGTSQFSFPAENHHFPMISPRIPWPLTPPLCQGPSWWWWSRQSWPRFERNLVEQRSNKLGVTMLGVTAAKSIKIQHVSIYI